MDKVFIFLLAILLGIVLSFVFSWPVMLLWNSCLVGAIDGIHSITWTQAWGISALFNALFKSYNPIINSSK
jgi:hypothetical protein